MEHALSWKSRNSCNFGQLIICKYNLENSLCNCSMCLEIKVEVKEFLSYLLVIHVCHSAGCMLLHVCEVQIMPYSLFKI